MLARILWYLDPLSSQQLKKPKKPSKLDPSCKTFWIRAWEGDEMTYMLEQLDSDHIGGRIQELSSGGGGPGHTDKKFDFFLV